MKKSIILLSLSVLCSCTEGIIDIKYNDIKKADSVLFRTFIPTDGLQLPKDSTSLDSINTDKGKTNSTRLNQNGIFTSLKKSSTENN